MFTEMSEMVICEITVPGSVMAENSTVVKLPRYSSTPTAPELWVPYIMIGFSCMTFLAVHFYCYHKRNRERYLRKRDEKRVKCGLLERRRITTLMVARYQSSLGICRNEAPERNTLYLNNVNEYGAASKGNNHDNVFGDEYIPGSSPLFSPATSPWDRGASSLSSETEASRLTSSQSWPLVSERRSLANNAHCKTIVEKPIPSSKPTVRVSQDASAGPELTSGAADGHAIGRPYRYGYSGSHRRHYLSSMLKPPPPSYSNAYYTNIPSSSQFTSPSPLFFKLKPNKRRFDGVPVDEMSDVYKPHEHHVVHDRGEISSPFYDDDGDVSEPYIVADPNDDGFGYGSRGQNHYHPTVLDASGFAVSEEEAYPFSDFSGDYDGIDTSPYMSRDASAIRGLGLGRFQGSVDCFVREPSMSLSVHNTLVNKKKVGHTAHANILPLMHYQVKTTSGKPSEVPNHDFSSLSSDWMASSSNHRVLNHTHSQSNAFPLNTFCETNLLSCNDSLLRSGQCRTSIGCSPLEHGQMPVKPYLNSKPPYSDNCVRLQGGVNLQVETMRMPSSINSNQSPWASPNFTKALPDNGAIQRSPTISTNFTGHTSKMSPTEAPNSPHPAPESHHSLNSPQKTPCTPGSVPSLNSPPNNNNNTPSTPGSCTSPSSPRTPTLRTLNPNLVFQHSTRKTVSAKPE